MRLALVAAAVWLLLEEALSESVVTGRSSSCEGSLRGAAAAKRPPFPVQVSWRSCSKITNAVAATTTGMMHTQGAEAAGDPSGRKSETSPHGKPTPAAAPTTAATAAAGGGGGGARAAAAAAAAAAAIEGGQGAGGVAPRFERGQAVEPRGKRQGMPSVTLKLAMDRNGAVDNMAEGPKRFTSQESLDAVHRVRRDCGAVLVGVGTVVRDNPSLTVRRVPLNEGENKQPTRVVLDRTLRLTGTGGQAGQQQQQQQGGGSGCAILSDGHASVIFYSIGCEETDSRAVQLTANAQQQQQQSRAALSGSSPGELGDFSSVLPHQQAPPPVVEFVGLPARRPGAGVELSAVLEALFERGIDHVLVEGGPSVARGFLAEGLVDRAVIIRAPVVFSHPVPSDIEADTLQRAGLHLVGCTRWGSDEAECWTRPGFSWPGGGVGRWP